MSNAMKATADEVRKAGGDWIGAARNWLQWHTRNGEHVTWGSEDVLEPPMTVRQVEDIAACAVAADRNKRTADADEKKRIADALMAEGAQKIEELRQERDALAQVLRTIGYEAIGEAEASEHEVYESIVAMARAAVKR